jgi:anti-sigma regulatory factor (Ser/Thr protein kinase)
MTSHHPTDYEQGYCGNCHAFTGEPMPDVVSITRDEYLESCKKRALEYLDAGDIEHAFTEMTNNLSHHAELKNHPGITIGIQFLLLPGWIRNPVEVRRWIVGFR